MEKIPKFVCAIILSLVAVAETTNDSQQRWCCKSQAELDKCRHLQTLITSDDKVVFQFGCVYAAGTSECIQKIKNGEADLMFLDGGDIYRSEEFLSVVAAEDYGEGDASYYAVAVVKNSGNEDLDILKLLDEDEVGRFKSCHTGVGKTSGWNTPIGWIARQMNLTEIDGRIKLYDPFHSSCAPGANNPLYMDKLPKPHDTEKWCQLCIGDGNGNHKCDRDNDEQYYGYAGAFRCLKEGGGDIAFVKHTTVPVDEHDNYSLLCPEGGRAHPSEWKHCTFARVPAHGLMMRSNTTLEAARDVYEKLLFAQENMLEADFLSYGGITNLLWKSSTKQFLDVSNDGNVMTSREYLGIEYYCNMKTLDGAILPWECVSQ